MNTCNRGAGYSLNRRSIHKQLIKDTKNIERRKRKKLENFLKDLSRIRSRCRCKKVIIVGYNDLALFLFKKMTVNMDCVNDFNANYFVNSPSSM